MGALCVNIDAHFIRDAVENWRWRPSRGLHRQLVAPDFTLEENILSKDEYRNAELGKRHFLDEQIRARSNWAKERKLAAILVSDIVGLITMGDDEAATLVIEANEGIHDAAIRSHSGTLLKKLGDGMLGFDSVSNAVACASHPSGRRR